MYATTLDHPHRYGWGLGRRAVNCLAKLAIPVNGEMIRQALKEGRLKPGIPKGYGIKTHAEVKRYVEYL